MKISLLPDGTAPEPSDEFPLNRGGDNFKLSYLQLVLEPLAAHEAAANPHPGYLTPAEANSLYDPLGEAAAQVATHVGLANPHPVYLTPTEADALYDALGAATAAVAAHAGAADPHPTYLRPVEADLLYDAIGAGAAAVSAHIAGDPHTQYQRESEKGQASGYAALTAGSKLDGTQQVYGSAVNTACVGNDARLSDARAPTAHASTHNSAGGDSIQLDNLAAPDDNTDLNATTGLHGLLPKLGGGTTNFLRADGTWAAPPGGGSDDVIYAPTTADVAINSVTDVTIATKAIAGAAAGDQYIVDAWWTILNNSTATRVITVTLDFGTFDIELATGALAFSTTLLHPFWLSGVLDIRSTSLAYMMVSMDAQLPAGMAGGADTTMAATHVSGKGWATTASNLTGTCTAILKMRSAAATATQTCRLHHFTIRKIRPIP